MSNLVKYEKHVAARGVEVPAPTRLRPTGYGSVYRYAHLATSKQVGACYPIANVQQEDIPSDLTFGEADQYLNAASAGPAITFFESAFMAQGLLEQHGLDVPYCVALRAARVGLKRRSKRSSA